MENREGRSPGFQYSREIRQDLLQAFGLREGRLWDASPEKVARLTRATNFLEQVENRASMDMVSPQGSVDIVITATDQPTKADVTRAVGDLTNKATTAGFIIEEESEATPGSITGRIPLADAPQLAINLFQHPDLHAVELHHSPRRNS